MINDIQQLIALGGTVVIILLIMSVAGLSIALFKLIDLRRFRQSEFTRLQTLAGSSVSPPKAALLEQDSSPLAPLFFNALRWSQQADIDHQLVRDELIRQAQTLMAQARRYLSFLELIVYLAPLLGLLGTVLGIIDVFSGLADANGSSETGQLAAGIWQALVTTAAGLSVAVPLAFLHALFESRVGRIGLRLEEALSNLYTKPQLQTAQG